jgi:hypothetical protein
VARGRTLLEGASSEPDALLLRRLFDPGNDPQRANDGLTAIAHDYVFSVYVVPPSQTGSGPARRLG